MRKSLASQGLAAIVMTPTLALLGHDGVTMAWQCDDLTLQIVENPLVNRARLKSLGLSSGTALDVAEIAAECLAGPQGGHFGEYSAKQVQASESNNLLVVKATFKTTCSRQLSSIVSSDISGHYVEIPFATRDELSTLSSEVMQISASFEGFSTEEIKSSISSLSGSLEALDSAICNLTSIFQPKGDYVYESTLSSYALKSEIPTKTSQLDNDSSFTTSSDLSALSSQTLADAEAYSDGVLADAKAYAQEEAEAVYNHSEETYIKKEEISLPAEAKYDGYVSNAVNAETAAEASSVAWDNVDGKPDIPTKTSQLENDSSYITSSQVTPSQDYAGYARNAVSAVNAEAAATSQHAEEAASAPWTGITDKPDLALKSEIPTKTSQLENDSGYLTETSLSDYVKRDELPSLSGYVTQEYVDEKISEEAGAREAVDTKLSSAIDTKASVDDIPTKTSQLENDSGYLTQHQSLSDYYTKAQTDEKIAEKQDAYALMSRND